MEIAEKLSYSISGDMLDRFDEILTPEALEFICMLENNFGQRRLELLAQRKDMQNKIDNGFVPDFLDETKDVRDSDWTVSPLPKDLLDRRVEITGPVDRKMIINALNSGVKVFMADFEDSNSPTWKNCLNGQINLKVITKKPIRPSENEIISNPRSRSAKLRIAQKII